MISRQWPGLLVAAGLAALFLWIVSKTEWVEDDVPREPAGEAATNDRYVLKRVLQGIAARAVERDDLSQLPPPGASLLLSAWNWDLLPERNRALRAWVEQGGNLVIEGGLLSSRPNNVASWIPIEAVKPMPAKTQPADSAAQQPGQPVEPRPGADAADKTCRKVAEPEGIAPAYPAEGTAAGLSLCTFGHLLSTRKTPLWALASEDGIELLRVGLGAGSVTAVRGSSWLGSQYTPFSNSRILKADNALIAVAALQARAGAEIWLVSGRGGQPLLGWLWSRARIAIELTLFALVLWLWRASARFGPVEAAPPLARRSMSEQISGTASFLWHRGPEALHAAQVRALDEAAALRVRQYARLDRVDRAAAISAATGVGASALAKALNPAAVRSAHALPRILTVLETARRRLLGPARTPLPSIRSRRANQTIAPEESR